MQYSNSYFGDDRQQAVLERIKDALKQNFSQTDIFPYKLVCEAVMGSANSYQFAINSKNQNTQLLPLQQGLLDSDLYIFYEAAITVDARVSTKPSSVIRWQFGNPAVFNVGASTGTASDIETFYNGKLSMNVSNVAKIQGLATSDFRHVGSPAAVSTASDNSTNAEFYANDLKYIPTTVVTLLGADQNTFQIDLTFGSSTPSITNTASNGQNVVSVLTNGFRIPQGTNAYRAILEGLK